MNDNRNGHDHETDGREDGMPTPAQMQSLAAAVTDMLPTVLASDERDARRNRALRRRRDGIALAAPEIETDLREAIGAIVSRIGLFGYDARRLIETPAALLAYVERAAALAMRDYPREGYTPAVTGLWDALDKCHTIAREAARNGRHAASMTAVLKVTAAALQGRYPDYSEGDSEGED